MARELRPSIYVSKLALNLDDIMSQVCLINRLELFLMDFVAVLEANGCRLIGHIKGTLDMDEKGLLFFNITSFNHKPSIRGEVKEPAAHAKLSINIIIYELSEKVIKGLFQEKLSRHFTVNK